MGGGRPRATTSGRAAARTLRSASTPPSFPRPLPSFLRRQEPTAPQHSFPAPIPNSSLPPSRGEVRWGVRGREPPPAAEPPPAPPERIHASVIPAPPPRHSCAGRNPPHPNTPFPPPSPIHPSPLPGGRLGGGWEAASHHQRPSGRPHPPERIHASAIPAPSVIPAPAIAIICPSLAARPTGRRGASGTTKECRQWRSG